MLSLFTAIALATQRPVVVDSPGRQSAPLRIVSVSPESTAVPTYGLVEWKVHLNATYLNPFDSSEIALEAEIKAADGTRIVLPGFFYQPQSRTLGAGDEKLTPAGGPDWRVRFSPLKEGAYEVVITARDKTGTVRSKPITLTAARSEKKGFARVSPKDSRYFAFADGSSYWPVGTNICWGGSQGTFAYEEWLPKYAENGVNYFRVWLSPSWTTFALEQPGKSSEGKGMGRFDLGNAWRLDYVMELARKHDVQLMLCIDSYNILRAGDAYPWWEKTPHNVDHGGPLRIPTDFWTNERMDKLYKDKLRYLVARYGAYSNMLAWEFWNEVDLTSEFDVGVVKDWHRRMATYLRTIDPYKHMITTSAASTMGFKELDLLPELDYFQTHHYGEDPARTVTAQQSRKGGQGRPHYIGEIGADAAGARKEDDPRGIQIHDPMWAAIATGSSGTAMSWWWDSLIAPNNLYGLFKPVADFVKDIDWQSEGFKQTTPSFAYQLAPKPVPRKDLEFRGGPVEWRPSTYNQPAVVRYRSGKVSGSAVLAGIQHGLGNHPDLHNPVIFDVEVDKPTRFEVEVGDVSGYGGAKMIVALDDKVVISKDFADPDGDDKTDTLRQYAGSYGLTIPAGRHQVRIENLGKDWFMVGYRFVDLLPRTKPAVEGWAVVGNTKAMAWLRRERRSWHRAIKGQPGKSPATVMALTGLASGAWTAEIWDTWKGTVLRSSTVKVPVTGKVRLEVPSFAEDIAVKLIKQ
ncbi:MAG TPA: DUF5060 domain-containing protein [Fimbriimonas sp.]|nr:DUF5060 domain-containing protein [Fimbriimonas sp.]